MPKKLKPSPKKLKPSPKELKPSNENSPPYARDWLRKPIMAFLFWGLPIFGILITNLEAIQWRDTNLIIGVSLLWMGAGSFFNAMNCGRVHCFFTGPWFVFIAILPMLQAFNVMTVAQETWNLYVNIVTVGTLAIWFGSEKALGHYR